MAGAKLGIKAKVLRNSGSFGSPTFAEVQQVGDCTLSLTWDRAEILTRGTRVKVGAPTMLTVEVSGKMLSATGDADYDAFTDAFFAGTPLDLLILDGPKETEGSEGVRGDFHVVKWDEDQSLANAVMKDFTLAPALTANPVQRAEVGAGGTITYTAL